LKLRVSMRAVSYALILWLTLAGLAAFANTISMAQTFGQTPSTISGPIPPAPVDANEAPSEFNHHMAGCRVV